MLWSSHRADLTVLTRRIGQVLQRLIARRVGSRYLKIRLYIVLYVKVVHPLGYALNKKLRPVRRVVRR